MTHDERMTKPESPIAEKQTSWPLVPKLDSGMGTHGQKLRFAGLALSYLIRA